MRSALVSAYGLKNEVYHSIQILVSCLVLSIFVITAYRSQPITAHNIAAHFKFVILIIFRVPRSRLSGIYFEWGGFILEALGWYALWMFMDG